MTMRRLGDNFHPLSWLSEGWAALRDKAHGALTYFQPDEAEETTSDETHPQRWGLAATDIVEHDDRFEVRMEIPGMDADDFDIQIIDDVLVVRGEKRVQRERKRGEFHIMERAYGRFERALRLPAAVDEARAEASYKRGVLRVRAPRSQPVAASRRIEVTRG